MRSAAGEASDKPKTPRHVPFGALHCGGMYPCLPRSFDVNLVLTRIVVPALMVGWLGTPARAADPFGDEWQYPEHVQKNDWQEQGSRIPDYPAQENLIALDVDYRGFRYFIDRESVSVGERDHVARYTVVIDSPAGARNVMYEGVRCGRRTYKTYAFGTRDQTWSPVSKTNWKPVRGRGPLKYRTELVEYYMCDGHSVRLSVDEIINLIRYPSDAYGAP